MGSRLQTRRDSLERRALLRLTLGFLAVFATVVAALSFVAYLAIEANLRSLVAPALDTPEGRAGLAAALRPALAAILSIDGVLLLVVGVASYVLARAALAPLARAAEREERFAADAAHELRTPLAAIGAIAQARAREAEELGAPGLHDAFVTIARRALECGSLVGDLLTLARADDASALDRHVLDFATLVEGVVTEVRAEVPSLRIDATFESAYIDGDERRLLQLVRNLLWNARDHARSQIVVAVAMRSNDAILTVDDDGSGVGADVGARLFERFAKGTDSRGSGLGLAIARWSARAHGGDLRYLGGSRFEARLPAAGP